MTDKPEFFEYASDEHFRRTPDGLVRIGKDGVSVTFSEPLPPGYQIDKLELYDSATGDVSYPFRGHVAP